MDCIVGPAIAVLPAHNLTLSFPATVLRNGAWEIVHWEKVMYQTKYCVNYPVYSPGFTSRVAEHLEADEAHVSYAETSL